MDALDTSRHQRARRIARLGGAVAGALAGVAYAAYLVPNSDGLLSGRFAVAAAVLAVCGLVGLVAGFVCGPTLSIDAYLWLQRTLDTASTGELVGGALGLLVALAAAALASVLLFHLPDGLGLLFSLALAAVLVSLGVSTGTRRRGDLIDLAGTLAAGGRDGEPSAGRGASSPGAVVVVDSSALIDGRVLDVARTGFLGGRLLVPGFVLEEVQRVADSGDPLRRARGRRGLSTVEHLQQLGDPPCEVVDADFPGVPEVDSRLLRLARDRGAALLTTDYTLNRLAQIEGLRVLNLNDLALALKPIVGAGETMEVSIVKEGKELHQGVGYLEDGTMVVVENGRRHLDSLVTVTVTSVIQTPAGRMIFAMVPSGGGGATAEARPLRPRGAGRVSRVANR